MSPESRDHQPLPVPGYTAQPGNAIDPLPAPKRAAAFVARNKEIEERVLRILDELAALDGVDKRWLAIGRTGIESGFMAVNRSIFQPQRIQLSEGNAVETSSG